MREAQHHGIKRALRNHPLRHPAAFEEQWDLIDGGLGQLHAALEAFATLDCRPPMVISLAKKEELIYIQRESEPIRLSRNNAGLRLCQQVRDEAHRFAQHYHHVLRRKKTVGE